MFLSKSNDKPRVNYKGLNRFNQTVRKMYISMVKTVKFIYKRSSYLLVYLFLLILQKLSLFKNFCETLIKKNKAPSRIPCSSWFSPRWPRFDSWCGNTNPLGFPGGSRGKEPAYQCRRHKRCKVRSLSWEMPWRRKQQPTPIFLPGESHEQRSLAGYGPFTKSGTQLFNIN